MQIIDDLIQKIGTVPEQIREPHITDKEIEHMVDFLLSTSNFNRINQIGIK